MTFARATPPADLTRDLQARVRSLQEQLADHQRKTEYLRVGYARYEHVRKMPPRQFAELYGQNLAGTGSFDELVDRSMLGLR